MVFFEPMDYVNRFLIAHHIEQEREESAQYAKFSVHFSYIIALQEAWDEKYDKDVFDELIDLPRPRWDFMPSRKSQRPTYMYRNAVKKSVDNQQPLAKTTASTYVCGVVKFYSFHLLMGYEFNNEPFKH